MQNTVWLVLAALLTDVLFSAGPRHGFASILLPAAILRSSLEDNCSCGIKLNILADVEDGWVLLHLIAAVNRESLSMKTYPQAPQNLKRLILQNLLYILTIPPASCVMALDVQLIPALSEFLT